jgi:hypothetical protein
MPDGKDPWKEPPQEPEFDLWLKKLRARWARRRPSGRDPWRGLRRNHRITLFIPLAVLVLFWLGTGFVTVPAGQVGYAFVLGRPDGTLGAGTHWLPPWPFHRVLNAAAPPRGVRLLRMHALTKDDRLVVVRLRYRLSERHPRRLALSYAGVERLRRARLCNLVARLVAAEPRAALRGAKSITLVRRRLLRLWAREARKVASPRPVSSTRGSDDAFTKGRSGLWGRLEILGLAFVSPRPLRKETQAFVRLAQREASRLEDERTLGRARLDLTRLEARALLASARRADATILARAQNRIAIFRTLLPVYRRDPALARRLLGLELLRRESVRRRITVEFGKKIRVLFVPALPTAGAKASPERRGLRTPNPSSSSGRAST